MSRERFELRRIGRVVSELDSLAEAPKQGDEGAPQAWVEFEPEVADALSHTEPGDRVVLITWLDRGDRATLAVHPRGDLEREPQGVFSTRSPSRPNPIGLHVVDVLERDGTRVRVSGLEAIDGTPVVDLKPALDADPNER